MTTIEVKNLSFCYDSGKEVLHDISFTLDQPEFVCIVGPNGVGKSTLIRCMNGLIKPTSGEVLIDGIDVREYKLKDLAKIVSYVPVTSGDFNVLTVLDTVLIGRYAHQKWKTTPEDIDMAHLALESMELDHLAMRNFNELSAGQHQKVSLARGLVQESKVIMLDEPTSNLDVRHQMYVSAFLKELVRVTGVTVVMISHDLNLSAKFADKMVVMGDPGVIKSIGTPKEVITEEMMAEVYGVSCDVLDDHGTPHVVLQSVLFEDGEA